MVKLSSVLTKTGRQSLNSNSGVYIFQSSGLLGNTLFEGVCIRLSLHCHNNVMTPVINMKESI